ncbi:MAG: hypothetical protein C4297_10875 [Gemmataceae bacterium]
MTPMNARELRSIGLAALAYVAMVGTLALLLWLAPNYPEFGSVPPPTQMPFGTTSVGVVPGAEPASDQMPMPRRGGILTAPVVPPPPGFVSGIPQSQDPSPAPSDKPADRDADRNADKRDQEQTRPAVPR